MSAWDHVDLAFQKQISPYFIYTKVDFSPGEFRRIVSFRVDNGFGYLLRYVTATWHDIAVVLRATHQLNDCMIEFFVRRQSRQNNPLPLNIISSPASAVSSDQIAGLLPAQPLGSHKFLNLFYQYGDQIEIHLTRGGNALDSAPTVDPAYTVYLVLKGYNIPEPRSRIW